MARVSEAALQLEQQRPAEAVALLCDALKIDPACAPAREALAKVLADTRWYFPTLELQHPMPVTHVAVLAPFDLWVSLRGEQSTTVHWRLPLVQDIKEAKIQSVLFPVPGCDSKALIVASAREYAVIARGDVALLCKAFGLKPICDLGPIPPTAAPESLVTFSDSGLLLAHPSFASSGEPGLVWSIRDAATGELIRMSPPLPVEDPRPLASYLSTTKLRVLRSDGSLWEMPISPVVPIEIIPPKEPIQLLQARFEKDSNYLRGKAADVAIDRGPIQRPEIKLRFPLEPNLSDIIRGSLMPEFPWSRQPGLWSGPLGQSRSQEVDGCVLVDRQSKTSPIICETPIEAVATDLDDTLFVGEQSGKVTMHRQLVQPSHREQSAIPAILSQSNLPTLEALAAAVTGVKYDESSNKMLPLPVDERLSAANAVAVDGLDALFPELDFRPLLNSLKRARLKQPDGLSVQLLTDRLARSHIPDSVDPVVAEVITAFQTVDDDTVLAAIRKAGDKGPLAAKALQLALQSEHANWIQASLAIAENLPGLLKRLAVARIARLENRNADALSLWPDVFPDLTAIRLREDWDGWEQADFMPAFSEMRAWATAEVAAINVGPDTTPEQRKAVAARLLDPATVASVGKPRFAAACLKAALAFSANKEEAGTTLELAAMARNLGAAPEPCLRAEALAYTALGDYKNAHPRWIELITEHPVETHIPGDYAEAAYTAFENSDPAQAMQILTTGMHRYPRDGNFALRAGWVGLLTGNPARAYQFLTTGRMIGFPPEKYENAIALLAIAASQVGASDDAEVYFQELMKIDPVWADAKTLDTLNWPEELKSVLRQFMR